ncbi:hypothetical protein MMC09_002178 [Bachmanniomyces sp. S44760]|nr:hypothetical protein [Bachmanniomyces sp. S44760]
MSPGKMAEPKQGILYVTMNPHATLPAAQFHDWYNNEHGPTRLRLPFISNGFRYRATDSEGSSSDVAAFSDSRPSSSCGQATVGKSSQENPAWMAIYDFSDMSMVNSEVYTSLRTPAVKSQREKSTMAQIDVDRRLFDLVSTHEGSDYKPLDKIDGTSQGGNVVVAISLRIRVANTELKKWYDGEIDDFERCYEQDYLPILCAVHGWLRTRRFVTSISSFPSCPEMSTSVGETEIEVLILHEYSPRNSLSGKEHQGLMALKGAIEVAGGVVTSEESRVWGLAYTFGPGPRDLESVLGKDAVMFESPSKQTRTIPPSRSETKCTPTTGVGVIESYITTSDGVELPYKLEGWTEDSDAPVILLSNSILVDWGIWDGFVASFFTNPRNRKYRILRYLTRGRSGVCAKEGIIVTIDVLALDIMTLLDALRIPKAAVLMGVSLGGATVLHAALTHPGRVSAVISCDTSAKSPAGNRQTWEERIELAEREGAKGPAGDEIVGEVLAEKTVRRWFVPQSYDSGETEQRIEQVKMMVQTNSLEGFKKSVYALFEYDMGDKMKGCTSVKGAFFVGSGDGKLPSVMKEMAAGFGPGAQYDVIDGAGHLPMVEKPEPFAERVTSFLAK